MCLYAKIPSLQLPPSINPQIKYWALVLPFAYCKNRTFMVYGPIVGTFDFVDNLGCWIELGIGSNSKSRRSLA